MKTLLSVKNLNAGYITKLKCVHAVRDVTFELKEGEFLGIAGESGCGKSTLAFGMTGILQPPGKIFNGKVKFNGKDLLEIESEELRNMRLKEFSIVFQSSMNVLNPVMNIKDQIFDGVQCHMKMSRKLLEKHAKELLELVKN